MALLLRAVVVALSFDSSSIPRIHMVAHDCNSSPPKDDAIFWPLWVLQACGADLKAGKTFIYTKQMNKISKKFIHIKK